MTKPKQRIYSMDLQFEPTQLKIRFIRMAVKNILKVAVNNKQIHPDYIRNLQDALDLLPSEEEMEEMYKKTKELEWKCKCKDGPFPLASHPSAHGHPYHFCDRCGQVLEDMRDKTEGAKAEEGRDSGKPVCSRSSDPALNPKGFVTPLHLKGCPMFEWKPGKWCSCDKVWNKFHENERLHMIGMMTGRNEKIHENDFQQPFIPSVNLDYD